MELKFRDLKADEIECRIGTIKSNGLSLLLYKNARVDMSILDETLGQGNWQRDHKEIKGNVYCGISIWDEDKKQWITKWDAGAESYTEKEKGEASDSFKRAGFNWGIGRELYTSPFIWIPSSLCDIQKDTNGKYYCYDKFYVKDIKIENKKIVDLTIAVDDKIVFKMHEKVKVDDYTEDSLVSDIEAKSLYKVMINKGLSNQVIIDTLKAKYNVNNTSELTKSQYAEILRNLNRGE